MLPGMTRRARYFQLAYTGGAVQLHPGYPVLFALHPTLAFRNFQELSGTFRAFQLLKL